MTNNTSVLISKIFKGYSESIINLIQNHVVENDIPDRELESYLLKMKNSFFIGEKNHKQDYGEFVQFEDFIESLRDTNLSYHQKEDKIFFFFQSQGYSLMKTKNIFNEKRILLDKNKIPIHFLEEFANKKFKKKTNLNKKYVSYNEFLEYIKKTYYKEEDCEKILKYYLEKNNINLFFTVKDTVIPLSLFDEYKLNTSLIHKNYRNSYVVKMKNNSPIIIFLVIGVIFFIFLFFIV